MPETMSGALPVLVRVSTCAVAAVPRFVVKLSAVALSCSAGAAAAVAVPESAMLCGEPVALSAMLRLALKLPAADGAKLTDRLQAAPAATLVPQVFVVLKLLAFVPASEMELTVNAAFPVLVRVTLCVPLVAPAVAVKLSELALKATEGVPTGLPLLLCELLELHPEASWETTMAAASVMRESTRQVIALKFPH
jgi:hypothetical protein